MTRFIILIVATLFIGCNEDGVRKTVELNRDNPYLPIKTNYSSGKIEDNNSKKVPLSKESKIGFEQNKTLLSKLELEMIKLEHKKSLEELKIKNIENLEKIKADREIKLKELEMEMEIKKALADKAKREAEVNSSVMIAKIESETAIKTEQERIFIYKTIAIMVVIIILIWLMFYYMNKASKRRHEAIIKEQELKFKMHSDETKVLSRFLDILQDENSDKEIKREVIKLINNSRLNANALEHKESSSNRGNQAKDESPVIKDSPKDRDRDVQDIEVDEVKDLDSKATNRDKGNLS
jgi:uncharacterized protein YxeA